MNRKPLIFLGVILFILFIAGVIQIYIERKVKEAVDNTLSGLNLRSYSYEDINVSLLRRSLEIDNIRLVDRNNREIFIERFIVEDFSPEKIKVKVLGVYGRDREYEILRTLLSELDIKTYRLNFFFEIVYTEDENKLYINPFRAELAEVFSISVKASLMNIERQFLKKLKNLEDLIEELEGVKLERLIIVFEDFELLKRIKEKNPEEIKFMKFRISEFIDNLDINKEKKERFKRAFLNFLERSGELIIRIEPERPLDIYSATFLIFPGLIHPSLASYSINRLGMEIEWKGK